MLTFSNASSNLSSLRLKSDNLGSRPANCSVPEKFLFLYSVLIRQKLGLSRIGLDPERMIQSFLIDFLDLIMLVLDWIVARHR